MNFTIQSRELPAKRGAKYGLLLRNIGTEELVRLTGTFKLPAGLVFASSQRILVPRLQPGGLFEHEIRVAGSSPGDYIAELHLEAYEGGRRLVEAVEEMAISIRERVEVENPPPTVVLDISRLTPDKWSGDYERVSIELVNGSSVELERVVVSLRGHIEGVERGIVRKLGPGEGKVIDFNLRALDAGKLRISVKCLCWVSGYRVSSAHSRVFWIEAAAREGEARQTIVVEGDLRQSTVVDIKDSVVTGSTIGSGEQGGPAVRSPEAAPTPSPAAPSICSGCGEPRRAEWQICPYCGQ